MIPVPRHVELVLALTLTAGLGTTLANRAVAAEPPTEGIREELLLLKEETVSIAVRHEQPISQAPSNVYVITDEDIRQSGAPDLPTVLRRIPGIEVMQVTGADFEVSARGDNELQANKLLVMVDGRSIYDDDEGFVFWKAIPVTLPEIKRIEVLKGPASSIYGFNAFDGVINIITKSPEEMRGTTLQFGGGEFGTISSAAIQAGILGNLGYRLSVGEDQTQQWRDRNALAFRSYKFNVHTEYVLPGDSKVLVSGGLVNANKLDGLRVDIFNNEFPVDQGYANVAYERPNFFIRAWWMANNHSSMLMVNPLLAPFIHPTDPNLGTALIIRAHSYNVEAQQTFQLGPANRLIVGANYRQNTLSITISDGFGREERLGFYIQDEWQPVQRLTFVAGVRYDLDSFINPTISPRAAVLYQIAPEHTFRAELSVGYRPPTLAQEHIAVRVATMLPPPFPSPPPTFVRGSKNLSPEEIVSYQAGYQGWYLKHRLRARADLFFNHLSDIIQATTDPTAPASFINGGEADIYGGEASLEFLAARWLSGFANYSYEEISQTFTGGTRRGAPRFKWNIGLRGDWENGLSGEVALYHVGAATYPINQAFFAFAPLGGFTPPSERVGSYNLLNLRGAYRFWQEKAAAGYTREAEVAVSVFNALNDQHKEHPLGDTIGSRVMGWLTMRF